MANNRCFRGIDLGLPNSPNATTPRTVITIPRNPIKLIVSPVKRYAKIGTK